MIGPNMIGSNMIGTKYNRRQSVFKPFDDSLFMLSRQFQCCGPGSRLVEIWNGLPGEKPTPEIECLTSSAKFIRGRKLRFRDGSASMEAHAKAPSRASR
jgi:hypothetical protein